VVVAVWMQLSFVRTVKKESGCEVQSIVEKDSGHPFNQAHIPSPEAARFWAGCVCGKPLQITAQTKFPVSFLAKVLT
jgi:hypothetical protein